MNKLLPVLLLLGGVAFLVWRNQHPPQEETSAPSATEQNEQLSPQEEEQPQAADTTDAKVAGDVGAPSDSNPFETSSNDDGKLEEYALKLKQKALAENAAAGKQGSDGSDQKEPLLVQLPPSATELPPSLMKISELMELKLQSSYATYELSPNQKSYDKLAIVYEKFAEIQCMPLVHEELEYEGPPEDPRCLYLLKNLERFSPNNPIIACAKHGLQSSSCKEGYATQHLASRREDPEDVSDVDLLVKLNAVRYEEKAVEVHNKTKAAVREYEKAKKAGNREKMVAAEKTAEELFHKLIPLKCEGIEIAIQHKDPEKPLTVEHAYNRAADEREPLQDILKDFTNKNHDAPKVEDRTKKRENKKSDGRATDEKTFEPFEQDQEEHSKEESFKKGYRVRILPSGCFEEIKDAIELNPHSYMAICHLEGFTSPNCIAAKKWRKEQMKREALAEKLKRAKERKKPEQGLRTF